MVNLQEASDLLRFCYVNDEGVKDVCSCNVLLTELVTRVQRTRYEEFVLNLAKAYRGYKFYLPAFMDFRGRIYRAGVLHFHERDLAKSLIIFSSDGKAPNISEEEQFRLRGILAAATAFKYKKFKNFEVSFVWYMKEYYNKYYDNEQNRYKYDCFINFAQHASEGRPKRIF